MCPPIPDENVCRGIELRLVWFDNDVLNLRASAWNGSFGGVAEIYEAIGGLQAAASYLRGFPKGPSDQRDIVFGNFDRKCAAGGMRLRFHCIDGAGHAYVETTIDANYRTGGTIQTAVLAMPVEAAAVDAFVSQLEQVELSRSGAALLEAKEIS
jgi:hypothetical protein